MNGTRANIPGQTPGEAESFPLQSRSFDRDFPLVEDSGGAGGAARAWDDHCTFAFINDPQLMKGVPDDVTYSRLVVGWLNGVEGQAWPGGVSCAGQPIGPLHSVSVQGDLTQNGGYPQVVGPSKIFNTFRALYERGRTPDSLKWPVYMGLGNHDLSPEGNLWTGEDFYRNYMWDYIRTMHRGTTSEEPIQPVDSIDAVLQDDVVVVPHGVVVVHADWTEHSFNYSVDLPTLHAVHLHKFGGDPRYGRAPGLQWLARDLAGVGTSKNVIVFQHFGWTPSAMGGETDTTWTELEAGNLLSIVDRYNIVAIIHGHDHEAIEPYLVNDSIPAFNPGAVTSDRKDPNAGRHLGIARITADTLDVAYGQVDRQGCMQWGATYTRSIDPNKPPIVYSQLIQAGTGNALDATSHLSDNVYTHTPNGGDYQLWDFVPKRGSEGVFTVLHKATGYNLDGGHRHQVYLHRKNGGGFQEWQPQPVAGTPGAFVMYHPATGLVLDANPRHKTHLNQPDGGSSQTWQFNPPLHV
ncbi:MAG TPA: metallophosphoesterase [Longimicrobiaceae bacterium]